MRGEVFEAMGKVGVVMRAEFDIAIRFVLCRKLINVTRFDDRIKVTVVGIEDPKAEEWNGGGGGNEFETGN